MYATPGRLLALYILIVGVFHRPVHSNMRAGRIVGIFEKGPKNRRDVFLKAVEFVDCHDVSGQGKAVRQNSLDGCDSFLQGYTETVDLYDSFGVFQRLCSFMKDVGVAAMLGPSSLPSQDIMYRISNIHSIPFVDVMPSRQFSGLSVRLHPDPDDIMTMLKELLQYWSWKEFLFVYEHSAALEENEELFRLQSEGDAQIHFYQYKGSPLAVAEVIRQSGFHHILVACATDKIEKLLSKALQQQILTPDYHFFFITMDLHLLDLTNYSYGGANITAIRLMPLPSTSNQIDQFRKFLTIGGTRSEEQSPYLTTHSCLLVDAVHLIAQSMQTLSNLTIPRMLCDEKPEAKWPTGQILLRQMKRASFDGLTGHIEFDRWGKRSNYQLYAVKVRAGGELVDIGRWSPLDHLEMEPYVIKSSIKETVSLEIDSDYKQKKLIITTVIQPPFVVRKNGTNKLEGFCIDLIERIQQKTGIQYEIRVNKNNGYGNINASGLWNGMVGEVMRMEADMAVAPLTITYDREMAIDFTKPFMTFGVSILFRKPQKDPPGLLSFLAPISYEVWGTVIVALVGVSISMYVLARFSPAEWENPYPCREGTYKYKHNAFNIGNAFWFTLGALMQQGGDVLPKGPSTRLLAITWWFFTLIIVASYTANLAAFLAITTATSPISNADGLAAQTEIKYGCLKGGSTCEFFKKSNATTFKNMWNFMSSMEETFVGSNAQGVQRVRQEAGSYAYVMESSILQYEVAQDCDLMQVGGLLNSLGYGIGVRQGSLLRDVMTDAILRLNEEQVLLELTNKWWKVEGSTCKEKSESNELLLENVGGIFVFLIGGLGVALVFLTIEVIVYTTRQCRQHKNGSMRVVRGYLHQSIRGSRVPQDASAAQGDKAQTPATAASSKTVQRQRRSRHTEEPPVMAATVDTVVNSDDAGTRVEAIHGATIAERAATIGTSL